MERLRVSKGTTTPQIPEETVIPRDPAENEENGFVGYYADFDGTPGIDGIIYADLLVGKPDDGSYGITTNESYSATYALPTDVNATNVKDYVVSETAVTDSRFDTTPRYVISLASSSTGTKDRFYVMGLDDIKDNSNNDTLYWYYSAYNQTTYTGYMSDYSTTTSKAFGTGKTNTTAMIAKWDAGSGTGGYGEQNDRDMWKWVKAKRTEYSGWFLPSIGEWATFANAFGIHGVVRDENWQVVAPENYSSFGIKSDYSSSSQYSTGSAWVIDFGASYVRDGFDTYLLYSVRLSATF